MSANRLLEILRSGETAFGISLGVPVPEIAALLARIGPDFLFVDMEHGPTQVIDIPKLMLACGGTDCSLVVRVPWNEPVIIKQVLDTGVLNLVIPMVLTGQDARAAVRATRYPPDGIRGFGPWFANVIHGPGYPTTEADQIAVFVQIEHITSIDHLDEILTTPGVTGVMAGPNDMTLSLGGKPGQPTPEAMALFDRVAQACVKHGPVFGIAAQTREMAAEMAAKGARFLIVTEALWAMRSGVETALSEARAAAKR